MKKRKILMLLIIILGMFIFFRNISFNNISYRLNKFVSKITNTSEYKTIKQDINKNYSGIGQEKVKNKEYVSNFKVRYSDIDFNKHVNNVKYVQWFMDSVPQEIREEYELKEIDILFEHECYYNDEIKCVCEIHKNQDNLLVLSNIQDKDGKELTVFVSKWQ